MDPTDVAAAAAAAAPPAPPHSLLVDPDEAVLVLVFLLPLLCVVAENGPRLARCLELERRAWDIEAAHPEDGAGGEHSLVWHATRWLPVPLRPEVLRVRAMQLFGFDVIDRRNRDLESALSAVVMQKRWGHARMMAQVALRQRDRGQNARALLTAVHTLRTVATAERGAHQQELQALEEAALAASAELQRERDERLDSVRRKGEATLESRLASERRRADADRREDDLEWRRALESAADAYRAMSASEIAALEAEVARAWATGRVHAADATAELHRARATAEHARAEAATLSTQLQAQQASAVELAKGSQGALRERSAQWERERQALSQQSEEAQRRATHLEEEVRSRPHAPPAGTRGAREDAYDAYISMRAPRAHARPACLYVPWHYTDERAPQPRGHTHHVRWCDVTCDRAGGSVAPAAGRTAARPPQEPRRARAALPGTRGDGPAVGAGAGGYASGIGRGDRGEE